MLPPSNPSNPETLPGTDAWSQRQLAHLAAPVTNSLMDVVWAVPDAGPPVDAADPGAAPGAAGRSAPCLAGYIAHQLRWGHWDGSGDPAGPSGSRAAAPTCCVTSLAVCPSFRGRGCGRALLRHVLAAARRRCCGSVVLHVRVSNAPAIALYKAEGFRVERVHRGYYPAPDGGRGREDAFLMVARL